MRTATERHLASLDTFIPGTAGTERDVRADMLDMRDRASTGIARANPEAAEVLSTVARLGLLYGFAPMSNARLIQVWLAMAEMMNAANTLQAAFREQ